MMESVALSLLGGILGCLLALPVHGMSTGTANFNNFAEVLFQFRITPVVVAEGIAFALIMGVIGGLLPARSAARMTIVKALRA
jgi:putative ABC transport system permease protein